MDSNRFLFHSDNTNSSENSFFSENVEKSESRWANLSNNINIDQLVALVLSDLQDSKQVFSDKKTAPDSIPSFEKSLTAIASEKSIVLPRINISKPTVQTSSQTEYSVSKNNLNNQNNKYDTDLMSFPDFCSPVSAEFLTEFLANNFLYLKRVVAWGELEEEICQHNNVNTVYVLLNAVVTPSAAEELRRRNIRLVKILPSDLELKTQHRQNSRYHPKQPQETRQLSTLFPVQIEPKKSIIPLQDQKNCPTLESGQIINGDFADGQNINSTFFFGQNVNIDHHFYCSSEEHQDNSPRQLSSKKTNASSIFFSEILEHQKSFEPSKTTSEQTKHSERNTTDVLSNFTKNSAESKTPIKELLLVFHRVPRRLELLNSLRKNADVCEQSFSCLFESLDWIRNQASKNLTQDPEQNMSLFSFKIMSNISVNNPLESFQEKTTEITPTFSSSTAYPEKKANIPAFKAVILTESGPLIALNANRDIIFRAICTSSLPLLQKDLTDCSPNLILINPFLHGSFELLQMIRLFLQKSSKKT